MSAKMTKFFEIEPAVDGGVGSETRYDRSEIPRGVIKLNYAFDDWLGDDLLCAVYYYIVTDRLASILHGRELSGFFLDDVVVTKSDYFFQLHRNDLELPDFRWLKIFGTAGIEDFGKSFHGIVVSERVMEILVQFQLKHAKIKPWSWPGDLRERNLG